MVDHSRESTFRTPVAQIIYDCRRSFYLGLSLTAFVQLLSIAPMVFMWNVFDRVIGARSGVTLLTLTSMIIGLYVFWSALEWLRSRLMVRISLRIDWDLAATVFDASFRRYAGHRNVNVHQILGDLLSLRQFFTGRPIQALMDAPFAIVFIIVGAMFHPFLAIFVFVATVLMLIASYTTQKVSAPILKASNDENAEAMRVAANSLRQAEATLALGMMGAVRKRWHDRHRKFLQYQVNASEAAGLTGGITGFLGKALGSLQMALGAWLALSGLITGGMVMAASMLISKAVSPIQHLISQWKDIVGARQAYDRINALIREDEVVQSRMQLPKPIGFLDVTGVSAIPPGSKTVVLSDINFKVVPGTALGIVGPSASGKTCLTRLLIGVWKPSLGSVRLDGVELSEWNHDEVGQYIGYVPQDIEFFDGTIAENIARLNTVDSEKVIEAARLIGMHEAILAFPEGYDTLIGEAGFVLSGGQKQRLAIARALYGNPKYVVMDEPNASLDEAGENVLIQAVSVIKAMGSSVILTTHRPRLVAVADNLLVLRAGAQVGYGTTKDMLRAVQNLQVVTNDGGEPAVDDQAPVPKAPVALTPKPIQVDSPTKPVPIAALGQGPKAVAAQAPGAAASPVQARPQAPAAVAPAGQGPKPAAAQAPAIPAAPGALRPQGPAAMAAAGQGPNKAAAPQAPGAPRPQGPAAMAAAGQGPNKAGAAQAPGAPRPQGPAAMGAAGQGPNKAGAVQVPGAPRPQGPAAMAAAGQGPNKAGAAQAPGAPRPQGPAAMGAAGQAPKAAAAHAPAVAASPATPQTPSAEAPVAPAPPRPQAAAAAVAPAVPAPPKPQAPAAVVSVAPAAVAVVVPEPAPVAATAPAAPPSVPIVLKPVAPAAPVAVAAEKLKA